MSYQALYRVWRPRSFTDVVGQTHITRTLQNAIMQEKFSHAYLFSGPRGTGKTSAAKIFAKTINCERSPVLEPCNECAACKGIQDGSISDVIEIDAASNNGVEQIRDIRDKVKYAPSVVPYKVYIIDEVHMLSIGAFNALLKTLEEPPKHVIFILATTEPHKIPLTIISRCQRFDFKRISQKAMVERMQKIAEAEQISATNDALEAVALAAEGGMRDALSLLDQAVSYSEDQVELNDVLAVTGSVSQTKLIAVIDAMYTKDIQKALMQVDELIQSGKDPGRFVFDLIYYLRDLLLYQSAPQLEGILERAIVNDAFKQMADQIDAGWIQEAITELNQCQQEIKWTNSPKVFIEITILKITDQKPQAKPIENGVLETLKRKMEQLESELNAVKQGSVGVQDSGTNQASTTKRAPVRSKNSYKIPFERIRQVLNDASKHDIKQVQSNWANFMDALKQQSAPAHATVQYSKPRAASDKAIILAFRYEIHCSLALDHKQTIELLLAEIIGKHLDIIPIPEANWQEMREEYVNKQQEQENANQEETPQVDPLVEEARKLVGDDLLEIKD
ncbi:DNA polymerase III subunit gamma/tau [Aquibacillus koreensis]|uniref:DNA-directed DNA polymerase n=1 Tax=Aquibacillus koreensis TaxID=279446 RepID=A0A9X3WSU2_9BACI|nr:DNA polymerase III subunit gamma/tau [Aquibacillus koreensis]MCT2536978.1 DNA polymerase III subunit gamma/tau [Aquibacillus koreensis]MDC3422719.1 DNA polymerase III subunit gamma/tau [Aquibacillus koreensis]